MPISAKANRSSASQMRKGTRPTPSRLSIEIDVYIRIAPQDIAQTEHLADRQHDHQDQRGEKRNIVALEQFHHELPTRIIAVQSAPTTPVFLFLSMPRY